MSILKKLCKLKSTLTGRESKLVSRKSVIKRLLLRSNRNWRKKRIKKKQK